MKVKHLKEGMVIKVDMLYPMSRSKELWIRKIALVKTIRHLKIKNRNTRSIILKFIGDIPTGQQHSWIWPKEVGETAFFSDELRTIRKIPDAEAIVWRIANNI